VSEVAQQEAERFATLLREGLALHQAGQFNAAAENYSRILERFPDHAETLNLYGVLLHQAGQNDDASHYLERAVLVQPGDAGYHNHLGVCLQALGQLERARTAYETARDLAPKMPEAAYNLSVLLIQLKQLDAAERVINEAVALAPGNIDARLTLVKVLRLMERHEDTIVALLEIHHRWPLDDRVYPQLAFLYTTMNDHEASSRFARRGVLVNPDRQASYVFLPKPSGLDDSDWPGRAVHLAPGDASLWTYVASLASEFMQNQKAVTASTKSILLKPDANGGYGVLTTCGFRLSRFKLSIDAGKRGLLLDPGNDALAVSVAFNCFIVGDAAEGWSLYERRIGHHESYPRIGLPDIWTGDHSVPRRLLVCAEQGVGDEFIFMGCLPDLIKRADVVIVECDPRNVALFERSFPGVKCVARTIVEVRPGEIHWDYGDVVAEYRPIAYILAGSLPRLCGAGSTRPALPKGYLIPDDVEAAQWRAWLRSLGSGLKVGLCWRSGDADAIRSEFYFTLEEMLEAIGPGPATFVSLVYIDAKDEITDVKHRTGSIVHIPPRLDQRVELDRVCALISELDIVLTIDCAVCAISGATGVPTIRMECSYFTLADNQDALFANILPCRDRSQPFNRDDVMSRAVRLLYDVISELPDPVGSSPAEPR
jgi:Flp pilus assembly protein TadD